MLQLAERVQHRGRRRRERQKDSAPVEVGEEVVRANVVTNSPVPGRARRPPLPQRRRGAESATISATGQTTVIATRRQIESRNAGRAVSALGRASLAPIVPARNMGTANP